MHTSCTYGDMLKDLIKTLNFPGLTGQHEFTCAPDPNAQPQPWLMVDFEKRRQMCVVALKAMWCVPCWVIAQAVNHSIINQGDSGKIRSVVRHCKAAPSLIRPVMRKRLQSASFFISRKGTFKKITKICYIRLIVPLSGSCMWFQGWVPVRSTIVNRVKIFSCTCCSFNWVLPSPIWQTLLDKKNNKDMSSCCTP